MNFVVAARKNDRNKRGEKKIKKAKKKMQASQVVFEAFFERGKKL